METCLDDTLFSILSFVGDYKEILRSSSRVCKRWNSLLNNYKNLLLEDKFESVLNTPPTLRELQFLCSQGNVINLRSEKDRIIINHRTSEIPSLIGYHVDSHNRKILYTRRTGIEYTRCIARVIHATIIDSPVIHNLMCVFQFKTDGRSNGWIVLNLGNPRTEAITRYFPEEIDSMDVELWVVGTDYRQKITIDPEEGNVVFTTCSLNIGTSIARIEITAFLF